MPTGRTRERDEAKRRRRQLGAPVLTGDPRTDGALLALASLLLDIAEATESEASPGATAPEAAESSTAQPNTG